MATFTLTQYIDNSTDWYGNMLTPASLPPAVSPTTFTYTSIDGQTVTVHGAGFTFNGPGGAPSGGIITSVSIDKGGHNWMTITGLHTGLDDAFYTLNGWNTSQGQNDGSSNQTFSLFANGNDLIQGTDAGNDDLFAGTNFGNDTINGLGGDDNIHGSSGNNTMDGGAGNNTLDYSDTMYNEDSAFRGANINLVTGVVLNPYGGIDHISHFQNVDGSRLADTITGSNNDEWFKGYRGADSIDGGNGYDWLNYGNDAQYGGTKAVSVNFATGHATDGFGSIDTFKNIEGAVGTDGNDTFTGGSFHDSFSGGKGVDTYHGGSSHDEIDFWDNDGDPSFQRAIVDLSRPTLQIQNDGWGNKESETSVEDLVGSQKNDFLTGNSADNIIAGGGGKDTLDGGLGAHDTAAYWYTNTALNITLGSTGSAVVTVDANDVDHIFNFENIYGGGGGDHLTGNAVANRLEGENGNDTLNGAGAADTLNGGNGADHFQFKTALGTTGIDHIEDFNHGQGDKIELAKSEFAALTVDNPLAPGAFYAVTSGTGHAAQITSQHIIYALDGGLWYDANGSTGGSAGAVEFAVIDHHNTLSASDFIVIA